MALDTSLPISKTEVISVLRELMGRVPTLRDELAALESDCVQLSLHLQKRTTLEVPHVVWHFLSDPDIRFKSADYAKAQLAETSAALVAWEALVPSNPSLERP